MTAVSALRPRAAPRKEVRRPLSARLIGLVVLLAVLVLACALSVALGKRDVPLGSVFQALFHYDPDNFVHNVIADRVPRTLVGLLAGVALGLAGTMMQGVARNPLADPGILGVNAGAAMFVVLAIQLFDFTSAGQFVWFSFVGAAVAAAAVYAIASAGRAGATPVKLALAGAACTAALTSITMALLFLNVDTYDSFRFWQVGSLANRGWDVIGPLWPFVLVGTVIALATGRLLNGLSLGDDVARSLGQRIGLSRLVIAVGVVVLCGAATSLAGPLAFVGLVVPHLARAAAGTDYRWVLPYAMVIAPILLLGADIIGRLIEGNGEMQVGIVTAFVGAPIFVYLVRRKKLAEL